MSVRAVTKPRTRRRNGMLFIRRELTRHKGAPEKYNNYVNKMLEYNNGSITDIQQLRKHWTIEWMSLE